MPSDKSKTSHTYVHRALNPVENAPNMSEMIPMEQKIPRVLVANRGEVAVRLVRAVAELGMESVALCSKDDLANGALHASLADRAVEMNGNGPAAYLDVEGIVRAAIENECDAVIPGYGFLSESAEFARAVRNAKMVFVGPEEWTLELFGDKVASKEFVQMHGGPVIPGRMVANAVELEKFFEEHVPKRANAVMLKASHGGGGKGMRVIRSKKEIMDAFERCKSEAKKSFNSEVLFVELYLENVKHVEVQVVCDATGDVVCLGERECSVQRSHQKMIEMTPCVSLSAATRKVLFETSVQLAKKSRFVGLGTFEYLVSTEKGDGHVQDLFFIECNPRLQVEHTVTEQVWGVDLVQTQLEIAVRGKTLQDLSLPRTPTVGGVCIQLRINSEVLLPDGSVTPSFGTLTHLNVPSGPGVRFDSAATTGLEINGNYDSLVGKLVVWGPNYNNALVRSKRSLSELVIAGIKTNASLLMTILNHPDFVSNEKLHTGFISVYASELAEKAKSDMQRRSPLTDHVTKRAAAVEKENRGLESIGPNQIASPLPGEVVEVCVQEGQTVEVGTKLAILSAFKMEHELESDRCGTIKQVLIKRGDVCKESQAIFEVEPSENSSNDRNAGGENSGVIDNLDTYTRPELEKLRERRAFLEDSFREKNIVEKRHKLGRRSVQENIRDIVDPGSWIEYGDLAIAAERNIPVEQRLAKTQRDGIMAGIGSVNGSLFDQDKVKTSCAVLSYDYLVIAGTQGARTHQKKDRLFELSKRWKLPTIILTEGGGGRPTSFSVGGNTHGLDEPAWKLLAEASDGVRIGVASGYNFAGNALLLGLCDIIIATEDASVAMAGPVMVEFAGQGSIHPSKLGPSSMHFQGGVVHMIAKNESDAVLLAKRSLSYFQGRLSSFEVEDQRLLRKALPSDRKKSYDVRRVIDVLADKASVLEYCSGFGKSTVTCFARVAGIPIGIFANQPTYLGGALDANGCEKAAAFLQLCNRHGLAVLNLCDTPGFIVGQEFEKTGLLKYTSRLFQVVSTLSVPQFTIVLRKAYGLGAMAMAGGGFQHGQAFIVGWPTAELGGMGLEGAVNLAFRKQLEAIEDPAERQETFEGLVAQAYEMGSGFNAAIDFSLDSLIDPAESRQWILSTLRMTRGEISRL